MAKKPVSFLELVVAASMITSNGWLDAALYALSRRALIFGPDLPDDQVRALDTFRLRPDESFNVITVIEANSGARQRARYQQRVHDSQHGSTEELFNGRHLSNVKTETTVTVRTDDIQMQPLSPDFGEHDSGFDTWSNKSGMSSFMGKFGKF